MPPDSFGTFWSAPCVSNVCSTVSMTVPFGLIFGVTFTVRPMSRFS